MDIKKLTILNVVLALAVVILFALHFMGGKSDTKPEVTDTASTETPNTDTATSKTVVNNLADGSLNVAWIDRKKVSEQFELSILITKQLQDEQIVAETKVKQMEANLEKKYKTFERDAKMMGNTELQKTQQALQELQMTYQQKTQEMQQTLAISSQEKEMGYLETTEAYMLEIAADLGYDYIFSYGLGGNVWCANPEMEISETVIKILNEKFANSELSKSFETEAPADSE